MSGDRLDRALWDVAIPEPPDAEERGRRLVEAAHEERSAAPPQRARRRPLPRLALGLGLATLIAALLLSPAGASVRDWVDDVFTDATPRPQPTLAEIPGGGRLLVQSAAGPWVVRPDGSRRLLGDYEEATWSPHGLFVAAVDGRTLSAVEPDGTPRWSVTAAREIGTPRWAPSGERIAYRAGFGLRVIAGDGTEDRLLAGSRAATSPAYVAPAWSPGGEDALAYVTGSRRLRVVDSETGAELAEAPALRRVTWMEWGAGGRAILEASPGALGLRLVRTQKIRPGPRLGAVERLAVPSGASVVDAALAPRRPLVAAVLTHWRDRGTRSSVVLYAPGGEVRRLLTVPGSLGQVVWSPDGRRLLVAWPAANQWLFLPLGRGQGEAVGNVSTAFAPGRRAASFPRVEGWCCPR
ncbi:MAG TPA: hypothetical protein VFU16_08985 [Solirubrobacterales bacterium]|nr:hypothetical protein [Solirubrobacterales bacterium]